MRILLLFCFIVLHSCSKEETSSATSKLEDISGLSNFQTKTSSGVSVILFHAKWCSICKAQRPFIEQLIDDEKNSKVYFGQVDYEANEEVNKKLSVDGFPTILMIKNGEVKHRIEGGGHNTTDLQQKLNSIL